MTNPLLTAFQLNTRLVPQALVNLSVPKQNMVLCMNCSLRDELIKLFWNLQVSANRATQGGGMLLNVNDSSGKNFGLMVRQQLSLYHFLLSSRSTGLARLIHQAKIYQNQINRARRRCINEP